MPSILIPIFYAILGIPLTYLICAVYRTLERMNISIIFEHSAARTGVIVISGGSISRITTEPHPPTGVVKYVWVDTPGSRAVLVEARLLRATLRQVLDDVWVQRNAARGAGRG